MYSILLVDDEKISHLAISQSLKAETDYDIEHAYNGEEALKLISSGKEYDLILLDAIMPGEDGFIIAKKIREIDKGFTPIIMMTALTGEKHRKMAFDVKINDYITKPIDFFLLKLSIQNLLELKKLFKEQYSYQKFYKKLIDSISDIIIVLNKSRFIVYLNQMAKTFIKKFQDSSLTAEENFFKIQLFDEKNQKNYFLQELIDNHDLYHLEKVFECFYQDNDLFYLVSVIPSVDQEELVIIFKDISLLRKKASQMQTVLEKHSKDLRKAAYVGKNLISKPLPIRKKMYIKSLYVPSAYIGGDFHLIASNKHNIAGIICDVSGHGVEAALYVTLLFMCIERYKEMIFEDIGKFTSLIDKELVSLNLDDNFITAFIFRLDLSTNILHYTNAGHPIPYFLRNNDMEKQPLPLEKGGLPIGLGFGEMDGYEENRFYFGSEEFRLIFYTDGLVEDFKNQEKVLSHEELDQLIYSQEVDKELENYKKTLLSKEEHPDLDDTTLIFIERKRFKEFTSEIKEEIDCDKIWEKTLPILKEYDFNETECKNFFVLIEELASNAAKYGQGGSIRIRVNCAWAIMNIKSNGAGFKVDDYFNQPQEEKVNQFLEKDFADYPKKRSLGFGLFMARQVATKFLYDPQGKSFTACIKKEQRWIHCSTKIENKD